MGMQAVFSLQEELKRFLDSTASTPSKFAKLRLVAFSSSFSNLFLSLFPLDLTGISEIDSFFSAVVGDW